MSKDTDRPAKDDYDGWIKKIERKQRQIIAKNFSRKLRSKREKHRLVKAYLQIEKQNFYEAQLEQYSEHGDFFIKNLKEGKTNSRNAFVKTLNPLMASARNKADDNLSDEICKLVKAHATKALPEALPVQINFSNNLCFFLTIKERLPVDRVEFREFIADYTERHPDIISQKTVDEETALYEVFGVNSSIAKGKPGVQTGTKRPKNTK